MPAAARVGDLNVPHCSGHRMATGSIDVFINNRRACRQGDITTLHLRPCGRFCCNHAPPVARGSRSVQINNRPAARVGDAISSCTLIAQGSNNVIIGG